MRVRRKPWAEEELLNNLQVIKNPMQLKSNWNKEFNSENPIHIEIGCGKGNFLIETAKLNTDINYIGIEHQISIVATAARKLKQENLSNIRLIYGDVKFLENYFDYGEIKRIYINFCDPWQKKRWIKRRLTFKGFLKIYKNLMGNEGEIHFKTDNKDLFEFSLNEFLNDNWKLRNISLDLHKNGFESNIMTEYEQKFSAKGLPIYRCEALYNVNTNCCGK